MKRGFLKGKNLEANAKTQGAHLGFYFAAR
jgi:hypothetical protein